MTFLSSTNVVTFLFGQMARQCTAKSVILARSALLVRSEHAEVSVTPKKTQKKRPPEYGGPRSIGGTTLASLLAIKTEVWRCCQGPSPASYPRKQVWRRTFRRISRRQLFR